MSAPNDTSHHQVFDGIEEHDNHLPNWWLAILYITIVFGFGYWFVYHTTSSAPLPVAEYKEEVARVAKLAETAPVTDEGLLALSKNPTSVEDGSKVFMSICAACHGVNAQGIVGPNLTDAYWLHGNKPTDIYNNVTNGYVAKGMPAWGAQLGRKRITAVVSYVLTLKGKNVPGKPPQGDKLE